MNPCTSTQTPCGRGAECRVDFHQARCVCPVGLQGNPQVACISVECQVDQDCRDDQACEFLSQTCVPVCKQDTCTQDATCTPANHQPQCTCNPGARGSGFVVCIRRKKFVFSKRHLLHFISLIEDQYFLNERFKHFIEGLINRISKYF